MGSSSTYSYENDRDYERFYESSYDSSLVSHCNFDGMSECSEEYFSIYEQSLTDSYSDEFEDELTSNFSFYDTDSSLYDIHSDNTTTTGSTPEDSLKSSMKSITTVNKPVLNGILKNRSASFDENNNTVITQAVIEKMRESELEDILQYAKDIINPDPTAKLTFCSQPAKVVEGSFRHLLSVKELHSKTGAFKYRTIEISRSSDEELGFNIRQGDGWEKKDGIYISRVALGSVFDQYEILTVGDEIMHVNKIDIKRMTVDDVIRLLHIPEKLSITIKMLTPFSKKRVEKSDINKCRFEQKKFIAAPSIDNVYKVAHMKIASNRRRKHEQPKRTILVRNKRNTSKESKTVKISPYRSMEDGKSAPAFGKNNLSPIREVISETRANNSEKVRRQSYVTWSDQRSISSDVF